MDLAASAWLASLCEALGERAPVWQMTSSHHRKYTAGGAGSKKMVGQSYAWLILGSSVKQQYSMKYRHSRVRSSYRNCRSTVTYARGRGFICINFSTIKCSKLPVVDFHLIKFRLSYRIFCYGGEGGRG